MAALPADAQEAAKEPAYRAFPLLGSRLAVWAIAQLHLNFAAFILGVPIFAVIIEIIGWRTAQERYDWLSHQFVKLTFGAFSTTALLGSVWAAINNYTWMPINIHRLIANIVFGGTIAAAYAAFRFLGATSDEERARYDWMGYVGNFVALTAFIVLPFAGYYLGREVYAFNQTMGITMMGGFMSWLWIIQAILIGILF